MPINARRMGTHNGVHAWMEDYSAMKSSEDLTPATSRMSPENVMLSEGSRHTRPHPV